MILYLCKDAYNNHIQQGANTHVNDGTAQYYDLGIEHIKNTYPDCVDLIEDVKHKPLEDARHELQQKLESL